MTIAVGSAFRNSPSIRRYLDQVAALQLYVGVLLPVRVIAVEGDSTDTTRDQLVEGARVRGLPLDLVTHTHGGPVFGSTEDPARLRALSGVGNAIFDAVTPDDDVLVYVESDLIWEARTIATLIDLAVDRHTRGWDVVAPLVFAGDAFYDTWGMRKEGVRFTPVAPYHPGLAATGITEVDSAGSCLVMRGAVARAVRIPDAHALVGWCAAARAQGFRIGVSADCRIQHP